MVGSPSLGVVVHAPKDLCVEDTVTTINALEILGFQLQGALERDKYGTVGGTI
ncbi:hypothetical protein [Microvirga vignae]|uniref:hypothetical protein n=1 Tax=Microvirga vignae TaxID=1225564 RepID=UPI000A3FED94|nr:hypothetical protein [Microvirga vignae]